MIGWYLLYGTRWPITHLNVGFADSAPMRITDTQFGRTPGRVVHFWRPSAPPWPSVRPPILSILMPLHSDCVVSRWNRHFHGPRCVVSDRVSERSMVEWSCSTRVRGRSALARQDATFGAP